MSSLWLTKFEVMTFDIFFKFALNIHSNNAFRQSKHPHGYNAISYFAIWHVHNSQKTSNIFVLNLIF